MEPIQSNSVGQRHRHRFDVHFEHHNVGEWNNDEVTRPGPDKDSMIQNSMKSSLLSLHSPQSQPQQEQENDKDEIDQLLLGENQESSCGSSRRRDHHLDSTNPLSAPPQRDVYTIEEAMGR
jgi:hypothetical protein